MLPKIKRLCKDRDFKAVYAQGRSVVQPHLVLQFRETGLGGVRVGIVTGKKVGRAVVRNRVKRRLRALAAERLPEVSVPCDLVLIARRGSGGAAFTDLGIQLNRCLKQFGLMEVSQEA